MGKSGILILEIKKGETKMKKRRDGHTFNVERDGNRFTITWETYDNMKFWIDVDEVSPYLDPELTGYEYEAGVRNSESIGERKTVALFESFPSMNDMKKVIDYVIRYAVSHY